MCWGLIPGERLGKGSGLKCPGEGPRSRCPGEGPGSRAERTHDSGLVRGTRVHGPGPRVQGQFFFRQIQNQVQDTDPESGPSHRSRIRPSHRSRIRPKPQIQNEDQATDPESGPSLGPLPPPP